MNNKQYYKHRIIASQFIPNPKYLPQVDHINHIKDDNHIENLRWVSASENQLNKSSYGRHKAEYIDELPDDAIHITIYKGIEFENYYYSQSTDKCYYDNGIKYRVLSYYLSSYGMRFVCCHDVENHQRSVYIDAWKRDEGL